MNENFQCAGISGVLAFAINLWLSANIVTAAFVAFPVAFVFVLLWCYAVDGWRK